MLQMIQVGGGGKVLKRDILRYCYENLIISIAVDPGLIIKCYKQVFQTFKTRIRVN